MYEIKLLLDYFCTNTTFYLQDFVKYEDIRANIYVIGVNLDWNHQESRARGQPRPFCSRCGSGGTCFSLIFIILFLPLFLFTSGTSLGSLSSLNQIKQVKLQVGISTFPSFFEMQIQSKSPINMKDPNEYKEVEILNPKLQQIPYADTKEYENKEVQKLELSTSSGSNWPITVDSRDKLISRLRVYRREIILEVDITFLTKNNKVFSFNHKHNLSKTSSFDLSLVLSKENGTTKTFITLPEFLPMFVRLPREGLGK